MSYRLPREPSTPRAALWRSLRKLGAVQVVDGLVALPDIDRTREQLDWLAQEVISASGEAVVWSAVVNASRDDDAMVDRARAARSGEYAAIETAALSAAEASDSTTRARSSRRLRRELLQVTRRDYFTAPGRAAATAAVSALRSQVDATP